MKVSKSLSSFPNPALAGGTWHLYPGGRETETDPAASLCRAGLRRIPAVLGNNLPRAAGARTGLRGGGRAPERLGGPGGFGGPGGQRCPAPPAALRAALGAGQSREGERKGDGERESRRELGKGEKGRRGERGREPGGSWEAELAAGECPAPARGRRIPAQRSVGSSRAAEPPVGNGRAPPALTCRGIFSPPLLSLGLFGGRCVALGSLLLCAGSGVIREAERRVPGVFSLPVETRGELAASPSAANFELPTQAGGSCVRFPLEFR